MPSRTSRSSSRPSSTSPGLRQALAEADGIVIRSGTQLTAEVLKDQPRLKAIVRAGVGVDNIDVAAATRQGIVVMNTPGGNTVSTAEHTMALMLALSRNVGPANASLKAGKWERTKFTGTQLEGKTLGIVGLGRVGQAVAKRAAGFDMKVVGFDPFLSAERAQELGVESVPRLDELWPRCDYITVHTPLSAETRNLIGARELATMKPSVAHHQLRPRRPDRRAGAGRGARRRARSPARRSTCSIRAARRRSSARQSSPGPGHAAPRRFDRRSAGVGGRRGGPAPDRLLRARADPVRRQHGRRSIGPSSKICGSTSTSAGGSGMLHAQMDRGTVQERHACAIAAKSRSKNTRLITASFAAGWLETALEDQVNLVNAEVLAKERGIEIVEESVARHRRLRHDDPVRGDHRAQDLRGRRHALRQAVPAPGAARAVSPRRPPRRHPDDLHAQRRPGLIGFIGTTVRPARREHRPDERGPQARRAARRSAS